MIILVRKHFAAAYIREWIPFHYFCLGHTRSYFAFLISCTSMVLLILRCYCGSRIIIKVLQRRIVVHSTLVKWVYKWFVLLISKIQCKHFLVIAPSLHTIRISLLIYPYITVRRKGRILVQKMNFWLPADKEAFWLAQTEFGESF